MPWPRRSEKERGNCGAAGDGGRVNNHSADDADKASTLPTRTLNASLSPVSRSLTSIQAKQPSQNSVSDRIHGMLKPRVRSVRERVLFFFDFDERCFAIDVDLTVLSPPPPKKKKKTSRARATATTARPTAQPTSSPASPTASWPRGTSRERKLEKGRSTPAVSAPSPRSRPLITRSRPRTRRPGRGRRTTGRSPAPRRRWGECCSPRGTAPGSTTATERARRETRAARVRPWPLLPPRSSRRGGAGPGSRSR